jgi:hypothetical protein
MSWQNLSRSGSLRTVQLALALAALATPLCFGQGLTNAGIRGHVADPSGAAVGGATVTASSPALLVAQVTTQTDSSGEYKLPDLPIGTYKVTYQSSGFQQFVRENVVLTAGFTATLDVALKVGNLSETVTVQAESPVVDTTQTTTGTDLNAKTLEDVIPASRNTVEMISTTPGILRSTRPDFGGTTTSGGPYSSVYGIQGQENNIKEGVNTTQSVYNFGGGDAPDFNSMEEVQVVVLNATAETANPGVTLNMIVKSGGNQFHGRYEGTGESSALQSTNLTPALQALGVTTGNSINNYESASADLGGPLKKDKLWFYGAYNFQHSSQNALNFINLATGQSQPVLGHMQNMTGKGTYQISPKYKLVGFYTMNTEFFNVYPSSANQFHPYQNTTNFHWNPHQMKAELIGTPTPRLVFDILIGRQAYYYYTSNPWPLTPETYDLTTGVYGGPAPINTQPRRSIGPSGTISYFPAGSFLGRHEFKAGGDYLRQIDGVNQADRSPYNYLLTYQDINKVPTPYEITTWNYPFNQETYQNQTGLFVQDTWHMTKQIVFNLGVRFDRYATGIPSQSRVASQFASAGTFPALQTGTWNEFAPRIGMVWNIFGDNKTVLRMSWGRFDHAVGDDYAAVYNQNAAVLTTYLWHAPVGSTVFTPGQTNLALNGPDFVSISGASNQLLNLKLKDPHTNEAVAAVEREIRPGLSVRVDFTWINEVNLTPYPTGGSYNILRPYSVYTVPFQVSIPTASSTGPYTANAPGSLGNITLYGFPSQYNGAAFVQNEYLNYPKSSWPINKVIDVIVTKRFAGKWGLTTSFTEVRDHQPEFSSFGVFRYPIPQNPNQTFFNEDTTWNWQAKATAYYNLPWKIVTSTTFEAYNGLYGQRLVNYTAANSGIASTLGTVTVPVDAYGSESGPVRIVWNIETGREFLFKDKFRLKPYVSILNLLNRADQWSISFLTGPTFLVPSVIDTPRIARFGAVFNF